MPNFGLDTKTVAFQNEPVEMGGIHGKKGQELCQEDRVAQHEIQRESFKMMMGAFMQANFSAVIVTELVKQLFYEVIFIQNAFP